MPVLVARNIRGLEVAMGDALRVRGVESITHLRCILQGLINRQWPLERRPLDVLHDQVIGADVVKLTNIGMIERSDRSGFAFKSLGELGLGNFDGDHTVKPCVAGLVNLSHATRSNGRDDLVRAKSVAGRKRHVRDLA